MAATWGTGRCPSCRSPIATVVPASPGARWFRCPHCGSAVPVVPPTNPPPIFSWEVFPFVYPPLPALRVPSRSLGRLATVALLGSMVLLAGLAGALAYSGALALGPTKFSVSGDVRDGSTSLPVSGATVEVVGESGPLQTVTTDAQGAFTAEGIPTGGVTLNVSAPGYANAEYDLFFSPTYSATGAGSGGLAIQLTPGSPTNTTVVYESPFGTLESFVSSLWSAGVLLAIAAALAAVGAVAAFRGRSAPVGVAAGLGAAIAPVALNILGVTAAFPLADAPAAALVGLGLVAAFFELLPLVWVGQAAELG